MSPESGKYIIGVGIILIAVGVIWYYFGDRLGFIGNLPGDIKVEKENFKFYFPLTTMILLSLIVNMILKVFKIFQ
jgi:Protein of unknown function (DUF2905)